jgi:short subunit dehydrogenase-like uncharacterized protein
MIMKYEKAAQASGSIMLPEIGIESAPPDLVTFCLAKTIRSEFDADTRDVTVSVHLRQVVSASGEQVLA